MPLDRYAVFYKVGDKQTAPGKEHLGAKHGDPICDVDEAEWGRSLDEILYNGGNPIFAVVQHDRRMKPFIRSLYNPIGINADGTIPDVSVYRPRAKRLPIPTLANLTGIPNLEANLMLKGYNVPLINGIGIGESAFVDALTLSNDVIVRDVNATTGGEVNVGPGEALVTWALAFVDLGNLLALLRFWLTGSVTETAPASITEDLGGFEFACSMRSGHGGDVAAGSITSLSANAHGFSLAMEGPGTVNMHGLNTLRTLAGATRATIIVNTITAASTVNIYQNIYDGGTLAADGFYLNDAQALMRVWSNLITRCPQTGIRTDQGAAGYVIEDNTVYSGGTGIDAKGMAGTYRRNACYADTTDFANKGGATGNYNASDDATGAGGWAAEVGNLINGDPAVDFDSVAAADGQAFLRPVRGGVLQLSAAQTYLAANTTDIAGNTWASLGDFIGARGGLLPSIGGGVRSRGRARGRA